jgi:two-component system, OmpR family, sensor kinase
VRRDGDAAELEVRDHGPGLPPGDPQALFGRFWRAEGGRERGRAGAGLGLAIVAAVVARHGGEVTAADAPGGGASFVVRLPAAPG